VKADRGGAKVLGGMIIAQALFFLVGFQFGYWTGSSVLTLAIRVIAVDRHGLLGGVNG
jgi:hypothetical protein